MQVAGGLFVLPLEGTESCVPTGRSTRGPEAADVWQAKISPFGMQAALLLDRYAVFTAVAVMPSSMARLRSGSRMIEGFILFLIQFLFMGFYFHWRRYFLLYK